MQSQVDKIGEADRDVLASSGMQKGIVANLLDMSGVASGHRCYQRQLIHKGLIIRTLVTGICENNWSTSGRSSSALRSLCKDSFHPITHASNSCTTN